MTRSTKFSIRRLIVPIAVTIAGIVTACSNDSVPLSQPLSAPEHASLSNAPLQLTGAQTLVLEAQGLLWATPRQTATSVTRTIRRGGGNFDFPGTGLQLQVPHGALSADMTFTITALAGSVVAYDFEPHGAVFAVPLTLIQSLDETNFGNVRLPKGFISSLQGAYFTNSLAIDQTTGISAVQELIPASAAWTGSGGKKVGRVSFPISHFSGYMISCGRSGG